MENEHIAIKPISNHPDDKHLKIVLHKNFKDEYVTHMYNSSDGGYFNGHYHGNDFDKALEEFNKRGC